MFISAQMTVHSVNATARRILAGKLLNLRRIHTSKWR